MNRTEDKIKQRILVVDDSEMNRAILADMLGGGYEVLEAENGLQAVELLKKLASNIDLVLLDIMMPKMDGFEVLAVMNKYHLIQDIPVIMISAERSASYVERAYEMGVTDYISRPYNALVVRKRVLNTLMLYAKQKRLVHMVADQIYEKEKNNDMMINILSHIVEFRNGESGLHILHIHTMTEILLERLCMKTGRYGLSQEDIGRITVASALHDVGKISIPDSILNKPGRLTPEEFEVMKSHALVGAQMLSQLPLYQDEPFIRTAYEICRWHHERYDGKGYPDGLKGDEIPISAQVVALADVYDALTSERCYKKAFSHDRAMKMILGGACGAFSHLLLECLKETQDRICEELLVASPERRSEQLHQMVEKKLYKKELRMAGYSIGQMDANEDKKQFFLSHVPVISFDYSAVTGQAELSDCAAECLGLESRVLDIRGSRWTEQAGPAAIQILRLLQETGPKDPERTAEIKLQLKEERIPCRVVVRSLWTTEDPPQYLGAVRTALPVNQKKEYKT